ncbi:DUF2169 family type VI secretion system accessory protein [Variovorax sp. W6]|uniref:DUF2169 family type VI secretion system accessory protein n=1 Tax=Variovorax sp. W6 TaxID=3093895 RepID=UPI003D806BCB
MKIIKPLRVSMLTRPFPKDQRHWLSMTAIAMTDSLAADARLVPEPEVWKTLAAELGSDFAFDAGMPKAGPEFLVTGNAYTHHQQDKTQCAVSVQVQGRRKTLHVSGDRFWLDGRATAPQPFDAMPIDWGHAFGGPGHAENPVGIGTSDEVVNGLRTRRLPNIELPTQRLNRPDDVRAPAGFGAMDETRPSRAARLGRNYDEHWKQHLFPGYASDMDWRYFNIAPEDQWLTPADGGLSGAAFEVVNMHPTHPVLSGRLPDWRVRGFVVRGAHHPRPLDGAVLEDFPLTATTAWFFPHLERVALIFHGVTPIAEDDAADISHAMVALEEGAGEPLPLEGYRETLVTRCESEDRALYFMRDEQLMPERIIGPWPDLDAAIPPPSPLKRNMQARAQQLSAELDAKARAAGVDTSEYERAVPADPALPTLRELPAFIAKMRQSIADQRRKLDEAREEIDRAAKANAVESRKAGFDTSTFVAEAASMKPKGPPRFDMWPRVERMASDNHAGGATPMTAEARAQMKRMIEGADEKLLANYRRTAQYQDAADPMASEAAQRVREQVASILAGSRDFSGMDLTGADLSGMDLRGTRWHETLLESADFTDSCLDEADMSQALLVRARFMRTSLQGANFAKANMALVQAESADFSRSRFDGTTLDQVRASGCDFAEAAMDNLVLSQARLEGCSFEDARLSSVDFDDGTELKVVRFDRARLQKASWIECAVQDLSFAGARLETCDWTDTRCDGGIDFSAARIDSTCFVGDAVLRHACFRNAALVDCSLRDARLDEADFTQAKLDNSDFSNASMRGAVLHRADAVNCMFVRTDLTAASLVDINLIAANLDKAVLVSADFLRANLFQADLGQCLIDDTTRFDEAYTEQVKTVPRRKPEEKTA